MKNNKKGITLIALIITIIVMIILAAVTVNIAVNGGLFKYAGKAKSQYDEETVREKLRLAKYEGDMKYYSNPNQISKKDAYVSVLTDREAEITTATDEVIKGNFLDKNNTRVQFEIIIETGDIKLKDDEGFGYTPLTAKISNEQIWDTWRNPASPDDGDTVKIFNLSNSFKKDGTSGVTEGHYLKFTALNTVSDQGYPQLRIDEYNENGDFVCEYSDIGTLYELSEERRIYLFTTSYYGYVVCLIPDEAAILKESDGDTFENCKNVTQLN